MVGMGGAHWRRSNRQHRPQMHMNSSRNCHRVMTPWLGTEVCCCQVVSANEWLLLVLSSRSALLSGLHSTSGLLNV